ncbi:MAG TPA: tetratricopeptide repeat protein, partial [Chitinophagaceae bacterium]|nr:tetratricopeptide repeat protein [Chitinophagaceae bacterium]
KSDSPAQLAESYIGSHLNSLSIRMGENSDSMQAGLDLFNKGQLNDAAQKFENIIQHDSDNADAKKFAGIVYLRLANYDKALQYFQQLEKYSLFSNPAKFYQALTLMKRNAPGDKQEAQQLLQEFGKSNSGGKEKEIARQWLEKW